VDPTVNGEFERSSLPAAGPVRAIEPSRRPLPALPLSGALAVATGGFLAGALALVTLRAIRTRRLFRRGRGRKEVLTRSVVGKRSFLVDVHLLGR
jgi:hypothetical protein